MPDLYVATNGLSVWSSADLGDTIGRMPSGTGMYSGSQVWALTPHPSDTNALFAGTDSGIYRFNRATKKWTHLPSPMDDVLVTAIAFDPQRPATLLAGTQPAALYRSEDAGSKWSKLDVPIKPFVTSGFYAGDAAAQATASEVVSNVKHWTRVTSIVFDPNDPTLVLAGVEIDGAWRSTDGGHTWSVVTDGLATDDIHGYGVVHDARGASTLFATTSHGVHVGADTGDRWTLIPIDAPNQYTRSIAERADRNGVVFLTNGNGPPGTDGRLFRSRDYGAHWELVPLPVPVESSLYFLATHPADPMLVFAATNLGQLFRSTDGGENWTTIARRLPEVRSIAWLPS